MSGKVKINEELCLGCGTCAMIAPKIFAINEKTGKAELVGQPENFPEEVKNAIESCPVGAISLEEQ